MSVPMSTVQLNDLVSHRLFDVGMHTVTHASLPFHSAETQSREIVNNRNALLKTCDHARNILAYPYGDYGDSTLAVVKKKSWQLLSQPVDNCYPGGLTRFSWGGSR